jgi:uncharacterized membrane protein YdbT with pleckstrin-like domain
MSPPAPPSPGLPPPQWLPAPGPPSGPTTSPPPPGLALKPSLRAAASVFAKVVAFIAFVLAVPIFVALLGGTGAEALAAILIAETSLFAVLPALAGILLPAIRLLATTYELDDEGVRVRSSIIARSDQRVPWEKVTLLVQHRSLVDRVLGIQTLTVVAYGAHGATLRLVGLRDPAPVRDYAARKMRASASVASLFTND